MTAYVALGSNLGDRAAYPLAGLSRLSRLPGTRLLRLSSLYETEPLGPPQPLYLNLVAEVETALPPRGLLEAMLAIERALGRERKERYGPRTLDLVLPHPRLHERAFVLVPLCDLVPQGRHPLLGRTFAELLAGLDPSGVRPYVV